jgi:hypothetical protein
MGAPSSLPDSEGVGVGSGEGVAEGVALSVGELSGVGVGVGVTGVVSVCAQAVKRGRAQRRIIRIATIFFIKAVLSV